jgi:hypothetical protein
MLLCCNSSSSSKLLLPKFRKNYLGTRSRLFLPGVLAESLLWIRDILVRIRICGFLTTDLLQIQIRILLFRQWLTRYQGTFSLVFKDKKSQNGRNQGFSYFFACWWKDPYPDPDPDPTNNAGSRSGSGRLKNIRIRSLRIRIHTTGQKYITIWSCSSGLDFLPLLELRTMFLATELARLYLAIAHLSSGPWVSEPDF